MGIAAGGHFFIDLMAAFMYLSRQVYFKLIIATQTHCKPLTLKPSTYLLFFLKADILFDIMSNYCECSLSEKLLSQKQNVLLFCAVKDDLHWVNKCTLRDSLICSVMLF